MRQTIHGEECAHLDIADSLHNLGRVSRQHGKLEDALKMHERCYKMEQAIHGEECAHRDVAASVNNLGRVHRVQGKLKKLLKGMRGALR